MADDLGKYIADNTKVEFLLNKDDDNPPFGYFHPGSEGKLTWICGEDAENRITSVFCFEEEPGNRQTQCNYITLEQALVVKKELVDDGWKKMVPPKITFTDSNNQKVSLNREQRRKLKRKMKKINNSQNPFLGK